MFDPTNWYWLADDGRLFASARCVVVDEQDEAYLAWLTPDGAPKRGPTTWPRDEAGEQSDAALQDVLRPYGVHIGLDYLKSALKLEIDEAAERERLKYITQGAGQAMTYQAKADEARRLLALPDPAAADPAEFPFLAAEVGITAASLVGVAEVVLAAYQQWLAIGAAIEAARQSAKRAVDLAENAQAARAVAPVWPQP